MITVERDHNPPVQDATGKWWRWDASHVTPTGNTVKCGGWTGGSKQDALSAAGAAESRLHHLHCTDSKVTGTFTINPRKRPPSGSFTRRRGRAA